MAAKKRRSRKTKRAPRALRNAAPRSRSPAAEAVTSAEARAPKAPAADRGKEGPSTHPRSARGSAKARRGAVRRRLTPTPGAKARRSQPKGRKKTGRDAGRPPKRTRPAPSGSRRRKGGRSTSPSAARRSTEKRPSGPHIETSLIHAAQPPDPLTGAVVTPVHFTTTYAMEGIGKTKGFDYSRTINPTRLVLERAIAEIEGGAWGGAFASGMAATDTLMRLLAPGDHVVASADLYGGTHRLFTQVLAGYGLEFTFVDTRHPRLVDAAMRPSTKLLFLETPTNPTLGLCDISALAQLARERDVAVAVDNTFASPALQRPLALGADYVVHSATKYIGGHSDVVGGLLVAQDAAMGKKLHFHQNAIGGILDPLQSFLLLRGLKTLHLRMERHSENATAIAHYLADHPKVTRVLYPGLKEHPQHELAKRQMAHFGGMVSFDVKGGLRSGRKVVERLALFRLAESLGAVESLVCHPVSMTHASIPKKQREAGGLTDGLLRLSVGVEHVEDLIGDLEQALRVA